MGKKIMVTGTKDFCSVMLQVPNHDISVFYKKNTHLSITNIKEPELYGNKVLDSVCSVKYVLKPSEFSRAGFLELANSLGVQVMDYSKAKTKEDVILLFDKWNEDRLLFKRSGKCNGEGCIIFGKDDIDKFKWNPEEDVFCPNINKNDGSIYKVEIFGGNIIYSWKSLKKSVFERYSGYSNGLNKYISRSTRSYWDPPTSLLEEIKGLCEYFSKDSLVSFDFMLDEKGLYRLIEINNNYVAVSWSPKQSGWLNNCSNALNNILEKIGE